MMDFKSTFKMVAALLFLCVLGRTARAQEDAPKFEVGAQFSSIAVDDDPSNNSICNACDEFVYKGVGGRFTYNVNDHFAVETEVNFFLDENRAYISRRVGGKPVQALFGVKAGRRFGRVGLFGKVRPGVISFGGTIINGRDGSLLIAPDLGRRTHFNLDVGGVFEVYPSRRVVLRLDAGDTIVHYGEENFPGAQIPFEGVTRHNFQFNAGAGLRF
ncbi:MAG: outer membrane beta-barrel protein [Pyrinomonadaceae bacterium]